MAKRPADAPLTEAELARLKHAPDDLIERFGKAQDAARKMGRPKSLSPKQAVSVRLDQEVVDHFKAKGAGWQTRINDALRKAAKL